MSCVELERSKTLERSAGRHVVAAPSGVPSAMTDTDPLDEQLIVQSFARVAPRALGISCGIVAALVLFAATAILLVKATMAPLGTPLGPHLGLLSNYFIGYAVSWPGAVVGLVYGFVTGFVFGYVIATFFNVYHAVYLAIQRRRIRGAVIDYGL